MIIITQPASEPVSLAEVKTQLGILTPDTDSDSQITRRIKEARLYAEQHMQRAIITQTQEIQINEFPSDDSPIYLPFPNLLSVVSVKYVDINGVEQTLTENVDYVIDTYGIIGHVRPAYGVGWPSARDDFNTVKIRYTCGYGPAASNVPDLIREAIMLLVGHWMNFQPAAESGSVTRVPFAVRDLLDRFTVYKIV